MAVCLWLAGRVNSLAVTKTIFDVADGDVSGDHESTLVTFPSPPCRCRHARVRLPTVGAYGALGL